MGRRLLFYWTILHKPENELVRQVLKAQVYAPTKNDWYLKVKEDLDYLDMNFNENDIIKLKKAKFKSILYDKIREAASEYLINLREKHTKSKGIKLNNRLNDYLTSDSLTTKEKQVLFQLRTRTFYCKANYSFKYESLICDYCSEIDKQEHLLSCKKITENLNIDGIQYSDIFNSTEKQIRIAKLMHKINEKRLHNTNSSNIGSQEHHI